MIFAVPDFERLETPTLAAHCLKGDQRAWEAMINRYGRLVYSVARRCGLGEADADDVFQNVFELLLRRLPGIRDYTKLPSWLITTAHRACWRISRQRKRDAALNDGLAYADEPDPQDVELWEQQHMVREALSRLSERDRELMSALFMERCNSDYAAIAKRLGMRPGSIGPTRARCFKKLEKTLIELGFDAASIRPQGQQPNPKVQAPLAATRQPGKLSPCRTAHELARMS